MKRHMNMKFTGIGRERKWKCTFSGNGTGMEMQWVSGNGTGMEMQWVSGERDGNGINLINAGWGWKWMHFHGTGTVRKMVTVSLSTIDRAILTLILTTTY